MITTGERVSFTARAAVSVALYVLDCPSCGVVFGITTEYEARRREDARNFYCPNGHHVSWSESDADRERARAERAERQRDAARSLAERESKRRVTAEHQRRAARGQVTKIKRRVGRGVCPCCNRTFADLQRHMAGQHPDFADVEATS